MPCKIQGGLHKITKMVGDLALGKEFLFWALCTMSVIPTHSGSGGRRIAVSLRSTCLDYIARPCNQKKKKILPSPKH